VTPCQPRAQLRRAWSGGVEHPEPPIAGAPEQAPDGPTAASKNQRSTATQRKQRPISDPYEHFRGPYHQCDSLQAGPPPVSPATCFPSQAPEGSQQRRNSDTKKETPRHGKEQSMGCAQAGEPHDPTMESDKQVLPSLRVARATGWSSVTATKSSDKVSATVFVWS